MTVFRSLHLPMSTLVSEYWTLHNLDCLFEYLTPIYRDGLVGGEALSPKSRRASVFHGLHPSRPCSDQRGPVTTSFARRRPWVSRRRASRVLGGPRLQGASRMRKLDAMGLLRGPQWQSQTCQAGRARSSVCATIHRARRHIIQGRPAAINTDGGPLHRHRRRHRHMSSKNGVGIFALALALWLLHANAGICRLALLSSYTSTHGIVFKVAGTPARIYQTRCITVAVSAPRLPIHTLPVTRNDGPRHILCHSGAALLPPFLRPLGVYIMALTFQDQASYGCSVHPGVVHEPTLVWVTYHL